MALGGTCKFTKCTVKAEQRALQNDVAAKSEGIASLQREIDMLGVKKQGVENEAKRLESFKAAGVRPRWYVDAKSLSNYRRLGLDAVEDGGSLVGARNKALNEAKRLGKACCEVSDDISKWTYLNVAKQDLRGEKTFELDFWRARRHVPRHGMHATIYVTRGCDMQPRTCSGDRGACDRHGKEPCRQRGDQGRSQRAAITPRTLGP